MEATDKLQIVLLGSTGSGKSASGNTILGEKVFKSYASTQSTTLHFQSETRTINGMEVTVVDTPGWHCTKLSLDEVASELLKAIESLNGTYAFLLVIPIGSFTYKEINMISILNGILGSEFKNQTTILFSFFDNLESKSFEQFLVEEKGELHELMKTCGNRVYTWNNKDMSSVCKLDEMLQHMKKTQKKVYKKTLLSQPELVENPSNDTESLGYDMKRHKKETPLDISKEVRVVVLGMAGEGKTSTIQTLSRQNLGQTERSATVNMTSRSGLNFKLFDTPGFKNVNEVKHGTFQAFLHANPGPHIIIIVIKVGRVTDETLTMVENIHSCLDNPKKHTMIIFSRKDDLDKKTIKEFINESSTLVNILNMHEDSRFYAINNKDIHDETQVNELFDRISAIYHKNCGDVIKDTFRNHAKSPESMGNLQTACKPPDSMKQKKKTPISKHKKDFFKNV